MGWINPAIITQAKGEKSVANFDWDACEDTEADFL
jgi:hypothetical protein